jgi:heterodisulfide reductase subunit C
MFFTVSLYISLVIFVFGLVLKVSSWFRFTLDPQDEASKAGSRVSAALKGIFLTLFSGKILRVLKAFFCDILFQSRILRENLLRWVMHLCLFWGFLLLLLMHALEKTISYPLFKDYSATLNPFLFLRNLFGLLVMIGLGISIYRRFFLRMPLFTNRMDRYALVILAVVMLSGFLLEGSKIGSHAAYQSMVEEYAVTASREELKALESYWVEEFGTVSSAVRGPFEKEILAQGKEVHEVACISCHSKPQWAFISYPVAAVMRPLGGLWDRASIPVILWYVHFLACFVGLAYLPFSRMFHLIASPLSLLANAVMDAKESDPANLMTKQLIELDACTHCGTCTSRCAVRIWQEEILNTKILPSEKLAPLMAFAQGKDLDEEKIRSLQEGLYLCSNCYRCTGVCPVGINLQELWFKAREAVLGRGIPEVLLLSPLSFYRALRREELVPEAYEKPLSSIRKALEEVCKRVDLQDSVLDIQKADLGFRKDLGLSEWGESYSFCFTCTTCSVACPVVQRYPNPPEALGLTPHQIIHAAITGFSDPIFKSNMLWSCLGCYQCQEACPQGVRVTDVLYKLKNMAMERLKNKKPADQPS